MQTWTENFCEKRYGRPINEIISVARKNLKDAGIEEVWIPKILNDVDGVCRAYENDLPKNVTGPAFYSAMISE